MIYLQQPAIMGILETELAELQQCVPRVIADSTVEACVPAMVRVNIEWVVLWSVSVLLQSLADIVIVKGKLKLS